MRDHCNLCFASHINKNLSLLPENLVFDLCSPSCGVQVILHATVDYTGLPRLLLLFGGVYHNATWMEQTCGKYNLGVCFIQLEHNETQGPIPNHCSIQETSNGLPQVEKTNNIVISFNSFYKHMISI